MPKANADHLKSQMRAVIFTDASNTTADSEPNVKLKDYFQGGYLVIKAIEEELSDHFDTDLWILLDNNRVVNGNSNVADLSGNQVQSGGPSRNPNETSQELVDRVEGSDVVIFALQSSSFQQFVVDNWNDLVDVAKPGSVWCLGGARSLLDALDFGYLRNKGCNVLTYQRVGVARVDRETREELFQAAARYREGGPTGGEQT